MHVLIREFCANYEADVMDALWQIHSDAFRRFWQSRILAERPTPLADAECDEIIKVLDRNGKGNTRDSEAVARAMVPQGAWRRMFNEFQTKRDLGRLVFSILDTVEPAAKAALIDELYQKNAGQGNNLTGPSGNTLGALLAAYDPVRNLSVISLRDRRAVIEFFRFATPKELATASVGTQIIETNRIILSGMAGLGLPGSARTVTRFLYSPAVQALWKGGETIKRAEGKVHVTVPTVPEEEEAAPDEAVRESMQIQGLIAWIGTKMGFTIWLPKADRSRVLRAWKAEPGELVDELPLSYDPTTTKTIEQIDVIWLRRRSIVRAFEVEHTTSVYSGLLRMADLIALQPNINVKLHIVAPAEKQEKVLQEIRRPVFSLLEGRTLAEMCTYLSYDRIKEIAELKHLTRLSDGVLEDYEEAAE
jgi:hypothetical protein